MADERGRRSSGGMYDPARDSWADSPPDRDEFSQPQRIPKQDQQPGNQQEADSRGIGTVIEPTNGSRLQLEPSTQEAASATCREDSRPTLPTSSAAISLSKRSRETPTLAQNLPRLMNEGISPDIKMSDTPTTSHGSLVNSGSATDWVKTSAIVSAGSTNKTTRPGSTSPGRKRKLRDQDATPEAPQLVSDRSTAKRKRVEERSQKLRRLARVPPPAYSRRGRDSPDEIKRSSRDEPQQRSSSPLPRPPTPEDQARQRKRPGGGARMGIANREVLRQRQEARERAQEEEALRTSRSRGISDVVRQHYNAVPERGRDWRKTESKIKGLRTFNNWIKTTLIQKFSPDEEFVVRRRDSRDWANDSEPSEVEDKRLLVLDLGCGKGGDLGKWQLAPQSVELYVGLDPAEVSIVQARDRYNSMRGGRGSRGRRNPIFHAEFFPIDCFGEKLETVPVVQRVGIDPNVGPGSSAMNSRWGGGGFDVVSSMFAIHYAFESEEKARQMLRNVSGALRKGGRFLGVCPNSDVISSKVTEFNQARKNAAASKGAQNEPPEDGEVEDDSKAGWGNQIYRVRFPGSTPDDGVFRPPFGWRYSYFMEEAVEEVPEYVVPWEAFRALTEDYNLELQYRKPFLDIWRDEKDDRELGPLSERMGVRDRTTGDLLMTDEEKEAASFYHAFCFYKV